MNLGQQKCQFFFWTKWLGSIWFVAHSFAFELFSLSTEDISACFELFTRNQAVLITPIFKVAVDAPVIVNKKE